MHVHAPEPRRRRARRGEDAAVRDDERDVPPAARAHAPNSPVRSFVGCTTGGPSSSARTFTAGGVRVRPRPAGLSGWHTTPTTSATSVSASSDGTANAGEPKKSARTASHGIGAIVICTRGWLTSWSIPSETPSAA